MTRTALSALIPALAIACGKDSAKPASKVSTPVAPRPDELPTLVSGALPFKYPASLYARKVQGNVTLRLFVDRDGRVLGDSTRVDETSGFAELDSAALRGASELHFVPAKLHGDAVPVSILFPVYFRHPEARPLPGDTILNIGKPG